MTTLITITDHKSLPELPPQIVIGFYVDNDIVNKNENLKPVDRSEVLVSSFLEDSKNEFPAYQYKKLSNGKPYLQVDNSTIGLSISHTFEYILVGINKNGEIGIDVEKKDRKIHPKLSERIKNPGDHFLQDISTLRIWTIKESILKLTGSGLRTNMSNIEIHQKSNTLFDVIHNNYSISIVSFEMSGCWVSVAWTKKN